MYRKRLCILTPEFYKKTGGIRTCVQQQVEAIDDTRINLFSLDETHRLLFRVMKIIRCTLISDKFYMHGVYFILYSLLIARIFPRKTFKLFIHGSELDYLDRKSRYLKKLFIRHLGIEYTNLQFIFVSEFLKRSYKDFLSVKSREDALVVYFGPRYQGRQPQRSTDGVINILTVSRIVKEKGLFEMADGFKRLDGCRVKWTIVGDGRDETKFREYIAKNRLENVELVGALSNSELTKYYNDADIFWLCSLYHEGLGLVYLEAAAHFLPSIGFDRGGVREAISDGYTGFLVDNIEDSLKKILTIRDYHFDQNDFESLCENRNTLRKWVESEKNEN